MDFSSAVANAPLEKDVCVYYIHLSQPAEDRAKEIYHLCQDIARPWTTDYIWQDEPFKLERTSDFSLKGTTRFDDCIEDEWFIVWILHELSKQCNDVFVRITDTDGEFLLIESARYLPRWLDPDSACNRAWIHKGKLIIIEPSAEEVKTRQCPDLTLDEALIHLRTEKSVLHDDTIQRDAFLRIRQYPQQSETESHRVRCRLPRSIATMLHVRPGAIAPICRAFYARDPLQTTKYAQGSNMLTAQQLEDQVDVTIRFTRTLYALIKGARFDIPNWYPMAGKRSDNYEASVTGSKLVCGTTLAYEAREDSLLFNWIKSLSSQTLPTNEEIADWPTDIDADTYLDVDFTEIEKAISTDTAVSSRPGDDETVKKMVEQMSRFMDGESNLEGAEFSDDEQDEDEDDYAAEDSDEEEIGGDFMDFLRAPMMGDSMLKFLRQPAVDESDAESSEGEEDVGDLKDYMNQLDQELLNDHGVSTVPVTKKPETQRGPKGAKEDEEEDLDDDLKIDFEVAKNLLASLNMEGGMSGPGATLLQRLGVSIPRHDDEQDDDPGLDEPLD